MQSFIKKHALIILVIIAAIIVRILIINLPFSPWWDPAIYVGMGKFLFSAGAIGMWEILRPPLMGVMIGAGWFVGFNPYVFAQYLILFFAIATMVLLYILGEKQSRGLGIAAAILLAISPVFSLFTTIPTSDIPSAFFALLGAYFMLKDRQLPAGMMVALSFLVRFPNGLFLVPFGLFILIHEWQTGKPFAWYARDVIIRGLKLAFGFAILAIPYFIINEIYFNDPLLPLKLGREVIESNPSQSFFFYIKNLILDNPLILLSVIGLVGYIATIIKHKERPSGLFTLSLLCALIVGAYMSQIGHKELRYSFGFLPYMIIFAAYGLSMLWKLSAWKYGRHIAFIVIVLLGSTNLYLQATRSFYITLHPAREAYYKVMEPRLHAITSSPQVMIMSDAKITGVFSSWQRGIDFVNEQKSNLTYVAIDSCQVAKETDPTNRIAFLSLINAQSSQIYSGVDDQKCELTVYKLR